MSTAPDSVKGVGAMGKIPAKGLAAAVGMSCLSRSAHDATSFVLSGLPEVSPRAYLDQAFRFSLKKAMVRDHASLAAASS
jgi:hypothetical protein